MYFNTLVWNVELREGGEGPRRHYRCSSVDVDISDVRGAGPAFKAARVSLSLPLPLPLSALRSAVCFVIGRGAPLLSAGQNGSHQDSQETLSTLPATSL